MRVPSPPSIQELTHISPSTYAAARICRARAVWASLKTKPHVPEHPSAVLGMCFHSVLEKAATGELASTLDGVLGAAREWFDSKCRELYESAHALLRLKFSAPDRMPGYYLFRERAGVAALNAFVAPQPNTSLLHPRGGTRGSVVEKRLSSSDGKLVGRPDVVDMVKGEVIDYKTSCTTDDDLISEAELRQLRLYVHLAAENGFSMSTGVITRANGQRISARITPSEARAEATTAEDTLSQLNAAIKGGADFQHLATPSASTCKSCPYMAFCEPFWDSAGSDWMDDCGPQLEGSIVSVAHSTLAGLRLVSLVIDFRRGTVPDSTYTIEQIPTDWLLVDGSSLPAVGESLRVLHARQLDADPATLRADRTSTTLWSIPATAVGGARG